MMQGIGDELQARTNALTQTSECGEDIKILDRTKAQVGIRCQDILLHRRYETDVFLYLHVVIPLRLCSGGTSQGLRFCT